MTFLIPVFVLFVLFVLGCDAKPEIRSVAGPVKGKVVLANGKIPKNVTLSLLPRDNGHPATMTVGPDGTFTGSIIPGSYSFLFGIAEDAKGAGKAAAKESLKLIPEAYKSASESNTIEIKADVEVVIEVK